MFWICETFCGDFVRLFSDWLCLRMPNFYTLDCHNNNNNNNNNDDNSAFFQFLKAPLIVNLKIIKHSSSWTTCKSCCLLTNVRFIYVMLANKTSLFCVPVFAYFLVISFSHRMIIAFPL